MRTSSIVTGIVVAAVSLISTASAVQINTTAVGSMFAASHANQQYIGRALAGVYNTDPDTNLRVYGVVARNPHSTGTQTVEWTGWSNDVGNNNCCTIYAQHISGGSTGLTSCVDGVDGYYTTSVTFSTTQAPVDSTYAAYCLLLANSANRIIHFRVTP